MGSLLNAVTQVATAILLASSALAEGAIWVSQETTGGAAWGTAYNYKTRALAESAAFESCGRQGTNCQSAATFNNICAALAVQTGSHNGWAVRYHVNASRAQRE